MSNGRGIKKGHSYTPRHIAACFDKLSKAALMDIAWNLCLLGTNETEEQMLVRFAREAEIVCKERGDRLPKWLDAIVKASVDTELGS